MTETVSGERCYPQDESQYEIIAQTGESANCTVHEAIIDGETVALYSRPDDSSSKPPAGERSDSVGEAPAMRSCLTVAWRRRHAA